MAEANLTSGPVPGCSRATMPLRACVNAATLVSRWVLGDLDAGPDGRPGFVPGGETASASRHVARSSHKGFACQHGFCGVQHRVLTVYRRQDWLPARQGQLLCGRAGASG